MEQPKGHCDVFENQLAVAYRLVLATSRHIGGLMEGAGGFNATDEALQSVQAAAQSIAWEDWIPVEGGAQFAQGDLP